jgi:hypothetical protein
MRNLSAAALAKIATKAGTEPIAIIEVVWRKDGNPILYADRDIGDSIKGRVLSVSDLDNVVGVSENTSSQEISITLDDTDGSIKEIFDTSDIHKRDVRLYQWFEGMDLDDRFLLFSGKLSSPITWNERDRTVAFAVVSQLEDKEVGFSAEEGEFPFIPSNLIGKTWPMIFGTVADVPALQFNHAVTGTALCGVGILGGQDQHRNVPIRDDGNHGRNMFLLWKQNEFLNTAASAFEQAFRDTGNFQYQSQGAQLREQQDANFQQQQDANNKKLQEEQCAAQQREQTLVQDLGCNPVRILGGEDFPQDTTISINIGGGIFTGYMHDDNFHIQQRYHQESETSAQNAYEDTRSNQGCSDQEPAEFFNFNMKVPVPYGDPDLTIKDTVRLWGWVGARPKVSRSNTNKVAQYAWFDAGSSVSMFSDEPITYVASIIPGTVLAVKAYKELNGVRTLVNVPNHLWYVETKNYGPVTAVQIKFQNPLSTILGQGWEDRIYVTFKSDVGPHTNDILEYIVTNYTDLEVDATSFAAVRSKLDQFPMNFPILDRKNSLTVLDEIAFQARCSLWVSDGKVYIKYLPEEPTADDTIALSDMDADKSVEVGLTATEDLITKLKVLWHLNWSDEGEKSIILRHNVAKYGTQEEEIDFYCFSQPDIVLKVATFWLIRKANSWKKIKFTTFLQKLNLETFDCVDLQMGSKGYVANGNVKAIVTEAKYNSADNTINFECWVPVRAGEMSQYQFAWPATISTDYTYPPQEDIDAGNAGGNGIGQGATGELPIGFTDLEDWGDGTVWVGGPNVVFGPKSDWGERRPTDVGFVAQDVILDSTFAELQVSPDPSTSLALNFLDPIEKMEIEQNPTGSPLVIDIRNTTIVDSNQPESDRADSKLDTIFKHINSDGDLVIKTDALFGDDDNEEEFDFKYDEDGEKFGAGTAFLKPND